MYTRVIVTVTDKILHTYNLRIMEHTASIGCSNSTQQTQPLTEIHALRMNASIKYSTSVTVPGYTTLCSVRRIKLTAGMNHK